MKHYLFKVFMVLLLVFGVITNLKAELVQIPNTPGTLNNDGASGLTSSYDYGLPFNYWYGRGWSKTLFTQSELSAAGVTEGPINSIALYMLTVGTRNNTFGTLKVWLENTTMTVMAENDVGPGAGASQIYQSVGNYSLPSTANTWVTFPCSSPFEYTGGGLIVYFCYYGTSYGGTSYGFRCSNFTTAHSYMKSDDNLDDGCATTKPSYTHGLRTFRFDMRIDIDMAPSIKGQYPTAGRNFLSNTIMAASERPAVVVSRANASMAIPMVTYEILFGNVADENVVYAANNGAWIPLNVIGQNQRYNFTSATGPRANTDGTFNLYAAPGGTYTVRTRFNNMKDPVKTTLSTFTVENVAAEYVRSYPAPGTILTSGVTVPNIDKPAVVLTNIYGSPITPVPTVRYKIFNSYGVEMYRALAANGAQDVPVDIFGQNQRFNFVNATGPMAGAGGELRMTGALPGEYTIKVEFNDGVLPTVIIPDTKFTIVRQNDILLTTVVEPRGWLSTSPNVPITDRFGYTIGANVPVEFQVFNGGGIPMVSFEFEAIIYNASGVSVDTINYIFNDAKNPIIKATTRQFSTYETINTQKLGLGVYTIASKVIPLNPSADEDYSNNIYPVAPVIQYFRVTEPVNVSANIVIPSAGHTYRYPFMPKFVVTNNGTEDISGSWAYLKIIKNNIEVHRDTLMLQNMTAGSACEVQFNNTYLPIELGTYTAELKLYLYGKEVTHSYNFTVEEGLRGTYTIGRGGYFSSFDAAIDMLYYRGVSGDVVFELIDTEYKLGGTGESRIPDFRSKILGVGPTASIIFRPSALNNLRSTPINIVINSTDGYGIKFGQALTTGTYTVPAVNHVVDKELRRNLATSDGYITFDGGIRKNIQFVMQTSNTDGFVVPVYIGEGARNISINNCRITGANYTSSNLPTLSYIDETFGFVFEEDRHINTKNINDILTYSAGVLIRNKPYTNTFINNINYEIDTIVTSNIKIQGNIIDNFGYGIVSIGIGVINDQDANKVIPMYNRNNEFSSNYIKNISKSGIFLGFEENTIVKNNRIDSVGIGKLDEEIYGIQVGGAYRYDNNFGYHNIGTIIEGNEVSNIFSNLFSYGIKIEQYPITVTYNNTKYSFPVESSEFRIYNNVVHTLKTSVGSPSSNKVGISLSTTRGKGVLNNNTLLGKKYSITYSPLSNPVSDEVLYLYPMFVYNIKSALVANNTIMIGDLNDCENDAIIAGVSVQNTDNYKIVNNAISLQNKNKEYYYSAPLMIEGLNPKKISGAVIDRNYYYANNLGGTYEGTGLVRLFEMDEFNRFLNNGGYANEYHVLPQWISWTGQDKSSVTSTTDYLTQDTYTDTVKLNNIALYKSLRMKTGKAGSNLPTTNSPLNNRALMLADVKVDKLGKSRINLDQNPDIGAFEFDCKTYLTDVEIKRIHAPASYLDYRDTKSNDAEYVMVGGPAIDVKAIIRNNGDAFVSNYPITCKIDTAVGDHNFTLPPTKTVFVNLAPGEEKEVIFYSEKDESNNAFMPEPYNGRPIPEIFRTMRTNITPVYTITVAATGADDEDTKNNILSKKVRFYIPSNSKDKLYLLVSAENTGANLKDTTWVASLPNSTDVVAGKLNYDTLITAFNRMQYFVSTQEQEARHFDIIDRAVWPERSINYSIRRFNRERNCFEPVYKSLFWSDGDDKSMSYWEKRNLIDYADAGEVEYKKNIVIASQEAVRRNSPGVEVFNYELQTKVLRAIIKDNGVYNGNASDIKIKGFTQAHDMIIDIIPTGYRFGINSGGMFSDREPQPARFKKFDTTLGINYIAYYYYNDALADADKNLSDKISVVSSKLLNRNSIYAGFDWRHLSDIDAFVKGIIDDIGDDLLIVPVELLNFDANVAGRKVILDWRTASEINSKNFEIERARVFDSNIDVFSRICTVKSAGQSNAISNYNITDSDVNYGSEYAYRIKMNDIDGSYSYSDTKIVSIEQIAGVTIGEVVPNPANEIARIDYSLRTNSDVSITLVDLAGKELLVLADNSNMSAGEHFVELNASLLTSGTYNLLFNINGKIVTKTLNVVK